MSFQGSISWNEFRAVFEPHLESKVGPCPHEEAGSMFPDPYQEPTNSANAENKSNEEAMSSHPSEELIEVMDEEALTMMLKKSKLSPKPQSRRGVRAADMSTTAHIRVLFIQSI